MKKILLLAGLVVFFSQLKAQDVPCTPDPTVLDSTQIVFPLPYDEETMTGGIADSPVCIGEPYRLVFHLRIPDSAAIGGQPINLLRAEIDMEGAVEGLPEGIGYKCNPPDCVFPDTLLGCIALEGTASANNMAAINDLVISVRIAIEGIGLLPTTIPGPFTSGDGGYSLVIKNPGECTVGVNDYLSKNISLSNTPNPVISKTTIEVTSLLDGDFDFQVFDLSGKMLHMEKVALTAGYNTFDYDASNLAEGMYIYRLSDGFGSIAEKMIVEKR